MGTPKNRSRSDLLTRDDLRSWALANMEESHIPPAATARISYALIQKFETHAHFLVASRNNGGDVLGASKVVLALVYGSRGRVSLIRTTTVIERKRLDDAMWREHLTAALLSLDLDPVLLEQLSARLGSVKLC